MKQRDGKAAAKQSNLQLLRILLIVMVIVLHVNNKDIGGGLAYSQGHNSNLFMMSFLESLSICAVNGFILLSGYFLIERREGKPHKVLSLFGWVIIYNVAFTVFFMALNRTGNIFTLLGALIPQNWYVILYCTLFLVSPYLNRVVLEFTKEQYKKMLIILLILFSVEPTFMDLFLDVTGAGLMGVSTISLGGSQGGYTLVNFVLLYFIGGYIRKYEIKAKSIVALAGYLCLTIVIWLFSFLSESAWNYCNIFVVFQAVCLFLLFKNMTIKSKVINFIAEYVFGIFLIHDRILVKICKLMNLDKFCQGGTVSLIFTTLVIIGITFVCALLIDMIAKFAARRVMR